MDKRKQLGEIFRFGFVGIIAVSIQYGLYLLLCGVLFPIIANTIAYVISFIFNYVASVRYTFRVKSSLQKGISFSLCHVLNYLLQTVLLALFISYGMTKQMAMLPVFTICVPINFIAVRLALRHPKRLKPS